MNDLCFQMCHDDIAFSYLDIHMVDLSSVGTLDHVFSVFLHHLCVCVHVNPYH